MLLLFEKRSTCTCLHEIHVSQHSSKQGVRMWQHAAGQFYQESRYTCKALDEMRWVVQETRALRACNTGRAAK